MSAATKRRPDGTMVPYEGGPSDRCVCARCASLRTPWSGRFDHDEIKKACRLLELKKPVSVGCYVNPAFPSSAGCSGHGDYDHLVSIHPSLSPEVAHYTVLHELRHCWQEENMPESFFDGYDSNFNSPNYEQSYDNHPAEIDADLWATSYEAVFCTVRQ